MKEENPKLEDRKEPKKTPVSKKFLIILIILLLLGIILAFIWHFLQAPVQGTITVKKPAENAGFEASNEQKRYAGEHIVFSVPGQYEEKSHTVGNGDPVLETIFLILKGSEGDKVAVTVEKRESADVSSSPSFQKRAMEPKTYQKEEFFEKGRSGHIFSSHEMIFEEVAFFVKDNLIVSISVTSAISGEKLRERLLRILRSVE